MLPNSLLFAMRETGNNNSILKIDENSARKYNSEMYGIFFSINGFKDRRVKENLTNINAWAIDIDKLEKNIQIKLITKSILPPSLIIESKNGYHVYWFAKDAKAENYKNVVENRLIPFFQADTRAKDICRILRMPNYWHWKDEKDPFLIKEVFRSDIQYKEKEMILFFKDFSIKTKEKKKTFTNSYNNKDALLKLSGLSVVKNETFSFMTNTNGTEQILVNGKKTSSWIDHNGNIGSYDRGGCTWIQWLKWYGHTAQEAIKIGEANGIRTERV